MALLDNSTEIVTSTQSGTGWSVDVTDCNLSSDVGQKDFLVYFNDVVQSNTVFTKTSSTTVTYTGSSIPSTSVTVVRDTPTIRIQEVIYGDRFTSSLWENEMNRIHRILFDLDVQKSNQIATDFSGIVTVETPSLLDDSQRVANTEWVRDILADFAQSSDVTVLNARFISNLLLLAKPDTGTRTIVILEGYSVNGDGGGGAFYWDEADTSTTVDNGTVFTVAGSSSNGRWKRIRPSDRHWNVRWFGAKGDNTTDDYSAMQACINASTDDSDVYIPSGQYRISQSLTFDHSRWTLRGDGGGSVIKAGSGMASGDALIDSQCSNRTTYTGSMTAVHIRDLGFDGANQNTVGILLSGFSQGCKIERVVMRQLYGGIYINGSWGWTISNSWIRGANASTGNGLWLGDSLNGASDNGGSLACNGFNVTGTYIYNWVGTGCYGIILDNGGVRNIKDSVIEYNEKSIWIKNGNVTNISGCYFEGNDTTTNIEIGTDGSSTKPSHINITNNLLNQDGVRFLVVITSILETMNGERAYYLRLVITKPHQQTLDLTILKLLR